MKAVPYRKFNSRALRIYKSFTYQCRFPQKENGVARDSAIGDDDSDRADITCGLTRGRETQSDSGKGVGGAMLTNRRVEKVSTDRRAGNRRFRTLLATWTTRVGRARSCSSTGISCVHEPLVDLLNRLRVLLDEITRRRPYCVCPIPTLVIHRYTRYYPGATYNFSLSIIRSDLSTIEIHIWNILSSQRSITMWRQPIKRTFKPSLSPNKYMCHYPRVEKNSYYHVLLNIQFAILLRRWQGWEILAKYRALCPSRWSQVDLYPDCSIL